MRREREGFLKGGQRLWDRIKEEGYSAVITGTSE